MVAVFLEIFTMARRVFLLVVLLVLTSFVSKSAEQILVLEQDYNIVEHTKDGPAAKDVRQKIYISKDIICIDEMGGNDGKMTESIIIDLKNRKIVNLNHMDKKKVTEDFDTRRKRIERRKKTAQEDLDGQPAGPQRDRLEKLYQAMLDDKRRYALAKDAGPSKELLGVSCQPVKVIAEDKPGYVPFEVCLHPSLDLPYENAEVLFLLQIIGEKMSDFLKKNKETFKRVPMELHLELAAGGRLDTKVVSVNKMDKASLSTVAGRGKLGSPFDIPEEYEEKARRLPTQPDKKDKPD
jgi:hypothetical protein